MLPKQRKWHLILQAGFAIKRQKGLLHPDFLPRVLVLLFFNPVSAEIPGISTGSVKTPEIRLFSDSGFNFSL
jgi:hypothetical protein